MKILGSIIRQTVMFVELLCYKNVCHTCTILFYLNPRYLSLFLDLQPHPGEDQCSILMQTPVAERTFE